MKKLFALIPLLMSGVLYAGSYTDNAGLYKPDNSETGWGSKVTANFQIIDSSFAALSGTNTFTGSNTFSGTVSFSSITLDTLSISSPTHSFSGEKLYVNGTGTFGLLNVGGSGLLGPPYINLSNGGSGTAMQIYHDGSSGGAMGLRAFNGVEVVSPVDNTPKPLYAKNVIAGPDYYSFGTINTFPDDNVSSIFQNPVLISTNSNNSARLTVFNTTTSSHAVVITSTGTGYALKVNVGGIAGGGYQNEKGAVQIEKLTGAPAPFLVLRDSTTDDQLGTGILELWEDQSGSGHNDPLIWIHNNGNSSNPFMRVDDAAPDMEIINTSTDNAHGLGKWEPMAVAYQGVDLQINNRAYDNSTFENLAYWHPLHLAAPNDSQMPGLYIRAQNVAEDAGVISSSGTGGIAFYTQNGRTRGLTAPLNTTASWWDALPATTGSAGNIMYHGGNVSNGALTVRQYAWSGNDYVYSATTGVSVSSMSVTAFDSPPSRTKATLQAMSPSQAGLIFYCSDCTTDGIVVSTGTGVGAFGRVSARGTAIQ